MNNQPKSTRVRIHLHITQSRFGSLGFHGGCAAK